MTEPLLSYEDALQRLQSNIRPVEPIRVSWRDARGSVLASDVFARENSPSFDNSAMDGFAVRAADLGGASPKAPVSLRIVGEIFAGGGMPAFSIESGCAAKIMTGAPVPTGADAIVIVENTRSEGDRVRIWSTVFPGENIRREGTEIQQGTLLLQQGTLIGPVERGLLASQGILDISVRRYPPVALFSTGDEVIEPEETPRPGQIRNANTYTLADELEILGCPVCNLGIVRDDPMAIRRHIEMALAKTQVLLTMGGVSAGEKDYLPSILQDMGMQTVFHKLNVKPGKPLLFGLLDDAYIFGLPGNVVSVLTSFHLFVKPALRLLTGVTAWRNPVAFARIASQFHNPGSRTQFVRCRLSSQAEGLPLAIPTGRQESNRLTSMLLADGFAVIPGDAETVDELDIVEFIPL